MFKIVNFLFFGDVEPDAIAAEPRTINVWRAAAPKIPHKLSAIFIECSWPGERSDDTLYGHLNPPHLVEELIALANEVVDFRRGEAKGLHPRPIRKKLKKNPTLSNELNGVLDGLRVYIIHCKDDMTGNINEPMRNTIVSQVRALVDDKKLGAEVIAVEPGTHIEI